MAYKFNKANYEPTPLMKHLQKRRVCKYCKKVAGIFDRWKSVCTSKPCKSKYQQEQHDK